MKLWKTRGKNYRLATILTHSLFLTIGVFTVMVLLQNFQVNRQVVTQEVARSKQQTSSLIQEIFKFRLKSIEIQQDSYSRSQSLVSELRNENSENISRFFDGIDQIDPDISPDFRFMSKDGSIFWNDQNHKFYGIQDEQLVLISAELITGNHWYISRAPSSMGMRYLMIRRTSMIAMNNGEVVGDFYAGVVLNNNFSLVRALLEGSNVDQLALAVGSEIIASSSKTDVGHIEWLEQYSPDLNANEYMISKVDLTIDGVDTFLTVYTVQNNSHIALLMRGHYLWVGGAVVLIFLIAIYTRVWLGQRVSNELKNLMLYTEQSIEAKNVERFKGSTISEFNKIGQSFQRSFKRLREQEKQFADLFNYSLSPIVLWDTNGNVVRMNPAAERCFRTDEKGVNLYPVMQEGLLPQIRMSAQGVSLTGVNIAIGEKTYRWNFSPIVLDNVTRNIMSQGQDVTSFIEAERQSQTAREEAEELAKVRADFLAKMSHELRTPLNGILGVSQILKGNLTDELDIEHVDVLINSGEHLLAVLNDILDFSRIEQGKFHIQHSEFRLKELVTIVEKIYRPLCNEKSIQLIVNSNIVDEQTVFSDQIRLNQILFNLVSNAIKFTHHGHVLIDIHLEQRQFNYELKITVEDTGIGIDRKRLQHIFDPFVQAEPHTTREYGGSGLGLAIVCSLVELFDGSIEVDSEIGIGSRFMVTVMVDGVLEPNLSSSQSGIVEPTTMFDRTLEVLLVEDNQTNAFIARAFCEKYGMKVTWVQDGNNAIEHLKHNSKIDLILMDNQLPNLGGIETTKIIRDELQLSIPIYACTADGMLETKRSFIDAGANFVIVKPIKEAALNQAFQYYKDHYYS
ncbi:response regulator [Vibrio sp. 404]|uniref:Autoinducer 2 sensor kinase/phosphatase LuxQ n=1 Tax=Vibrio marinisediminis TaxID=2758441 RepID=A0A7W2FTH3_9VIBR|nr:quorum-sensing autoinducer 2 sensor kinase/phosphatase LuxQ [Vibrio marinisediminis]MBA5763966.1 response regulator [Vibrio marinisediminis]